MDNVYRPPDGIRGTILQSIVAGKMRDLADAKRKWPEESIRLALERSSEARSLKKSLARSPGIIAEVKKASPSAGLIRSDFDPYAIVREYEEAGAVAVSVVTERRHFQGRLETLAGLRWRTKLPLLRKDFIFDPYQILESRHAGADAVLLIAALHDARTLKQLRRQAEDLGMDALVEVHNYEELDRTFQSGATFIGVNNRDLRSFEVSLDVSLEMAERLPKGIVSVAESGIRTPEDVRRLAAAGYRGFLVGTTFLQADSTARAAAELVRALGTPVRRMP